MSEEMQALPLSSPIMVAWQAFQRTEQYANSEKWAAHPEFLKGSLWELFCAGYWAALKDQKAAEPKMGKKS